MDPMGYIGNVISISTLWLFNIAMENGRYIVDFYLLKMVIFHGYVK